MRIFPSWFVRCGSWLRTWRRWIWRSSPAVRSRKRFMPAAPFPGLASRSRLMMSFTSMAESLIRCRWTCSKKWNPWSTERSQPMHPKILATRWQELPENIVVELQAEKLRHYLRNVVLPFSPHYREMFEQHGLKAESIQTLEDLEQIPFTSK